MEWLTYLLKVTACTVLFFGFYLLFLRKLTFFKINRFYLLVTLSLSFMIPTLQFEVKREIIVVDTEISMEVPKIKPVNQAPAQLIQPVVMEYDQQEAPDIDWYKLAYNTYAIIALLLLAVCLYRLFNLLKHTRGYSKNSEGLKLVPKTKGFTNCSFFNYIFIDKSALTDTDLAVLLKHEQVHARQYHSIDKIILMVFKSILWFNPIVYLYDKALEQVHEYEADEITSNGFGNRAYANLLLKLAISKSDMPLIHNFVKSPIKDRIKMLFHLKSKNRRKLTYLLALPVTLGLFWLFAVQVVYAQNIKDEHKPLKDFYQGTLKGKVITIRKEEIGFYIVDLLSDGKIYPIVSNGFKEKIKVGDELIVHISGKGSNMKKMDKSGKVIAEVNGPIYNAAKITTLTGNLIYEEKIEKHAFLFEANKARSASSKIKAILKSANGKIEKIVLNDGLFTINLNLKAQNLIDNHFKVGDQVMVKFIGEKLVSKNTYTTDQMIVLYSQPKKYLIKNEALYNRFYFNDGKQKIAAVKDEPAEVPETVKPKIISYAKMKDDRGAKIHYMDNAVVEVLNHRLEAEYIALDKTNNRIIAKNGILKSLDGKSVVKATAFDLDLNKGLFGTKNAEGEYHAINLEDLENKKEKLVSANDKVEYSAEDSVKTSKDKSVITLYGKARFGNDNFSVLADEVTINKSTKTVSAKNLTLTNKNSGITITGYYGEFDMKGKLEIWQDNK